MFNMDGTITHTFKIGRSAYTIAERSTRDAFILKEVVDSLPEFKTNEGVQISVIALNIAQCFKAYYNTIPYWKVFKKIKYKYLSDWKVLNKLPIPQLKMFQEHVELFDKRVKKKTKR